METIHIDVYADVVCPWCYLGKHRLAEALEGLKDRYRFVVRWLPFELQPDMPEEGLRREDYMNLKFGDPEIVAEEDARLADLGRGAGLVYNFGNIEKSPNSLDAHRLAWFAQKHGLGEKVVEALFKAYFTDGRDLGDRETLVQIGAQQGLKPEKVRRMLESGEGADEVRQEEERAYENGVEGVPFFVIEDHYAIPGAHPSELLREAIEDVVRMQGEQYAA